MDENDGTLVGRFARKGDTKAFAILVERYADMVYSTCHRILGNETQAADAAQETFYDLMKYADRITGSLGCWLHRVATRRAIDLIRQEVARRRREETYSTDFDRSANSWAEVEPLVDQAMDELSPEARDFLVLHFLEGKKTTQIAAAKGISQPTVSRRIADALEELREKLRNTGVVVGIVPLQTLLIHSASLAPDVVKLGLRKMVLAQAATKSGKTSLMSKILTAKVIKTALATAGFASLVGIGGLLVMQERWSRSFSSTPVVQHTVRRFQSPKSQSVNGARTTLSLVDAKPPAIMRAPTTTSLRPARQPLTPNNLPTNRWANAQPTVAPEQQSPRPAFYTSSPPASRPVGSFQPAVAAAEPRVITQRAVTPASFTSDLRMLRAADSTPVFVRPVSGDATQNGPPTRIFNEQVLAGNQRPAVANYPMASPARRAPRARNSPSP